MTEVKVVAMLLSGRENYGVRQAVLSLSGQLTDRGIACRFISVGPGAFVDELRDQGEDVVTLGDQSIRDIVGRSPSERVVAAIRARQQTRAAAPALNEAILDCGADAIYVRWPNLVALAGSATVGTDARAFWHMPNIVGTSLPLGINRWCFQYLCRRYRIVPLANSRFTAKTLGQWPVKPEILYVGTNADRFDPATTQFRTRRELNISDDAIVLGVISRLDRSKGQDRVLAAMLKCQHPLAQRTHLVLVGGPTDGDYAEELRRTAEAAGASERLHMAGRVNDVPTWYGLIDVAVNSRIDPEPFGQSVVEAMLMERPVLAHALGGPAESVADAQTGWHVEAPDVETWRQALHRVLEDQPQWRAMGAAGRERALHLFTAEAMANRFLEVVRRATGKR